MEKQGTDVAKRGVTFSAMVERQKVEESNGRGEKWRVLEEKRMS